MKIFMVYGSTLDEANGSTSHVVELFRNLKKRNAVICFARKSKYIKYKCQEIVYVPLLDKRFFIALSFQLVLFLYLFYYCIKIKPDTIYARQSGLTFSPVIISQLFRIPYFVEINGLIIDEIKICNAPKSPVLSIYLAKLSERFNYKHAKKIVAVTQGIKGGIMELYNILDEKIVVIENGANTDLFEPIDQKEARKKLELNQDANYVCFVGNLAPWQGVEYLIQSAPLILKEIPNTKFLIVGDGSKKEELMKLTEQNSVFDNFIFAGAVPYKEVPKYINASDVCVAPFIKERNIKIGLSPLKIYEYDACGKPIVSSRIPNLEFIEQINAGILVEPENPEELAKAIIKLMKDEKLREKMGKNGREYVVKNHSWEAVAIRVAEVCVSTISEDKRI